jgi:hypothetical protein
MVSMTTMEPKSYMAVSVFPVSRSALRTGRVGGTPGSLGWKSELSVVTTEPSVRRSGRDGDTFFACRRRKFGVVWNI